MADDGLFTFLTILVTILICAPGSLLIPAIGFAIGRRWFRQRRSTHHTEDAHDHSDSGTIPHGG